ncbi:hypothetical protein EJ08DRAFT_703714 [Tothia fuscella]|uniref:Peptidase S33 tripeptidyl aminopeptidase-like C-terminal domain-containing protein n=1 Tax=Tothia fuscella TaxID=1048955 RepID=A0A9P4TRC9_9PEZI|nr:hypothetical protein EJ08DRAFT_703714 [Tothia fuscella]
MFNGQLLSSTPSNVIQDIPMISYRDVLLPADALRRSTRKRPHVNYVREYSFNDSTSSEEEEDFEPTNKRVKPTRKSKPLPKHKLFPFMRLPAELRNKIYEMALLDTGAIYVSSKTKSYRRVAKRCKSGEGHPQYDNSSRYRRSQNLNSTDEEQEEPARNVFSPSLLAVSKTIYCEAASLLYSQPFVISDNYALLTFLNQIGPRHAEMLRNLTIKSWCDSRSHQAINFPAMAVLAYATNLERLNIACAVGYFRHYGWRTGKSVAIALKVARKIYRDCYPWLESIGRTKKDVTAGVALLEVSVDNFEDGWNGVAHVDGVDEQLKPSTTLQFHPCFESYECARLDVPLDWTANAQHQVEHRAAIAITKVAAKVSVTDERYGGAVLVNPGGPGGSGVGLVTREGRDIQTIIDPGKYSSYDDTHDGSYYDVIGFDPRGVNKTTPAVSCFPDDAARQFWAVQSQAQVIIAPFLMCLDGLKHYRRAVQNCWAMEKKSGKYVSTPNVVEDMVAIIEAIGEWRERRAKASLVKRNVKESATIAERVKWVQGKEKLMYWGFSYGTLLGTTSASMHPDKVGRMVLDGVCDAKDYYAGTWLTNLYDTNSILDSFFKQCYAAGPNRCHLFSSKGPEGSLKMFDQVLASLYQVPLSVPASEQYGPDLITWSDVVNYVIVQALYQPQSLFTKMARIMYELSQGNGTELAAMKQNDHTLFCKSPMCEDNPYSEDCYDPKEAAFRVELSAAILCADAPASLQDWRAIEHYHKWQILRKQSNLFAPYWTEITMYCSGWKIRPVWNFTNPDISSNETANPILFVSNTRDPVTPLMNARTMQGRFAPSGLLVQNADGHCSMSAPGICVAERVRRYFRSGEIPEDGLLCRPDKMLFEEGADKKEVAQQDAELHDALLRMSNPRRYDLRLPLHL